MKLYELINRYAVKNRVLKVSYNILIIFQISSAKRIYSQMLGGAGEVRGENKIKGVIK